MERACTNIFARRADFPRFKKKAQSDSFRYPDPKQIKLAQAHNRLFLPKLGWLRYRNSRNVPGTVKNVTVSQSCGKWFVSIQAEREVAQSVPQSTSTIGIYMGVARFATLSDGMFYAPLNSFKRHEKALRRTQQAMSRKVKFSNNWKKSKTHVQKIHSPQATSAVTSSTKSHPRSAKNTRWCASRAYRYGICPSRRWAQQMHREETFEPPQNLSRTCPCCGHVSAAPQTQVRFLCVECGFGENADLVDAINVLRAGHARLACKVSGAVMPPTVGVHRSDSCVAQYHA